jgi:predicted RNA-binding protein with PIN domain
VSTNVGSGADPAGYADAADAGGGADVVLGDAARRRLVELAADVVARLPAEQVPASLRAVARFTPAKRARLGGTALAAALDADEQFRTAVADVVAEATPQLVELIRSGAPTAASDPVDTAVVAYLLRPPGWTDLVRTAADRARAERNGAGAVRGEAAKLRTELVQTHAELARARADLRTRAARQRDEQTSSLAAAATELAEVRKQLRVRTAELRTALGDRDEARAAVEQLRRAAAAAEAAQEIELRRARARISDLERSAEAARRGVRRDRDVDTARLSLLIDTLVDAAAGLRRELSLPPASMRPADTVEAGGAAVGGGTLPRTVTDAMALDRLLALPHAHLIVDGYNVTKTGYGSLPLADQRSRLVGSLAALAGRVGAEVTVAFDGAQRPPAQPQSPRGVRVLFSAAGETADDLIRRLVAAEPRGRPVVVVTTDQEVVADVLRAGGWTVPASVFLERVGQ